MQFIQKTLLERGKLTFVVHTNNDAGGDTAIQETSEISSVVADPAACTISYHLKKTGQGNVLEDDYVIRLHDVHSVVVIAFEKYASRSMRGRSLTSAINRAGTRNSIRPSFWFWRAAPEMRSEASIMPMKRWPTASPMRSATRLNCAAAASDSRFESRALASLQSCLPGLGNETRGIQEQH